VEELERLDTVLKLLRKYNRGRGRLIWLGLVIVGLAILWGLWLLQKPVRSTEVTLIADVSYVEFVLATSQAVIGPIPLEGLETVGAVVELPPDRRRKTNPVSLRTGPGGNLSFDPGAMPAETWLSLRPGDRPNTYMLRLRTPKPVQIAATARGILTGVSDKAVSLSHPSPIRFDLEEKTVTDFVLEIAPTSAPRLVTGIAVRSLKLYRVPEQGDARETSAILDGKLYLEELHGRLVDLRAGQILLLEDLRKAELGEVILKPDRISLVFGGEIGALKTGPATARTDRMPTKLESLQAKDLSNALWAGLLGVATIVGVVTAVMTYLYTRRGGG
jgi:hypothetical protein